MSAVTLNDPEPQGMRADEITSAPDSSSHNVFDNHTKTLPPFDSATVFNAPERKPLKYNIFLVAFTLIIGFGFASGLIVSYCIGLGIFGFRPNGIGFYGVVLVSYYVTQFACAIYNRFAVNRIAKNHVKNTANARAAGDCEKGQNATGSNLYYPDGEVSISIVGYREDEQAWRQCLRSLQAQTLKPKCFVAVVDGNEEPDLDMARDFVDEFKSYNVALIQLPSLLSEMHREVYWGNVPTDDRYFVTKIFHWLSGTYRKGHEEALVLAREAVIKQVQEWDQRWNISSLDAVVFSQPHGHKRTAMFTAFAMSLYAIRARDGIFTTDSDTLVNENALDEMLLLLQSSGELGGVIAEVKLCNRGMSWLTAVCSARYWFAFNVERACQSIWGCVCCLSGPMSLYRCYDLETIMGPWNLQTFGGKDTTFGDDRHMTNQLLAHGRKTRYTHRTWCNTESPSHFVPWIIQQTRWSKSFFREAFWFPIAFIRQSPWLLLETFFHSVYPFIIIITVFYLFYSSADISPWRPVICLCTMIGAAFVRSILAFMIARDPWLLLFAGYGLVYFFGLLPSKVYAIMTMTRTGWGNSARSSAERKRGLSFFARSFHVIHLVVWYLAIFIGVGYFTSKVFGDSRYFLIGFFSPLPIALLYWQRTWRLRDTKSKICAMFRKKAPEAENNGQSTADVLPTEQATMTAESLPDFQPPANKAFTESTTSSASASASDLRTLPATSTADLGTR